MVRKTKDKLLYFLFFILVLGFTLRLLGIGYGLPYLSHPDEARAILDTLSMGHRFSLLPERPDYALLYRYLLLFIFGICYFIGKFLGTFLTPYNFALKFFINHTNIYLIARLISVILGIGIGILAYIIGKKIFQKKEIGMAALIFALFEFQLLQHSQWAIYPIVLSFCTLPAFYYMFKLIGNPIKKNFFLSGLFCGLAISVQNQGVFLVPSLILTYMFTFNRHKKEIKLSQFSKLTGISLFLLVLFSLLGNFYWFFVFKKAWAKTVELWGVTRVGFSSSPPYHYNIFSMLWWFMNELIRQDMLLGIIMVLGFFYSLYKRTAYDIIYIIFIVIYLYFISNWGFRLLHNMLSLLPIMCIFGARFFVDLINKFFRNKYCYLLASFLIVLPLISDSLAVDIKKMRKDTRIIAKEWVEENIPRNSKIGVDWSIFSLPLEGDIPFLLRNPVAKKYYEENSEPILKEKYQEYLNSKISYKICELMYWSDEPIWPADMPKEVIKEAQKKLVYRDLYSKFIFQDMESIRDEGIEYLIITSYSWGFFLLNNDPYKKNLFNPFIKDRPYLNYSHTDHYINDKRHGIIFYLAKQGRNFYIPLLYNELSNIKLIKEFEPTNNLGPTIKIFKIIKNGK